MSKYVYDEERGLAVPEWTTACPDWEDRIINGQSIIPCGPIFPETAENYRQVFDALPLVDADKRFGEIPKLGQVSKQWSLDYADTFFGSLDLKTGVRLIKEFFMLIPKKNAKSTKAAGLMLSVLIRNDRYEAEFIIVAPTKRIADNAFEPAKNMITYTPQLNDLFHVQGHIRKITHRGTGATLTVLAADTDTLGGSKAAGILIDELWLFGNKSKAVGMLEEAKGGMVSRKDGFVIYLTTQAEESPKGVFSDTLNYARRVRDGEIVDRAFLPVIYEYPDRIIKSGEHLNPKNFYMVNPNMGASVVEGEIIRLINKAKEMGEESLATIMAKHLNVQIGLVLRGESWAAARYWEDAAVADASLERILNECDVVTLGTDGGGLDDMFALAVLGRIKSSGKWLLWAKAWLHKDVLNLRKQDAQKFLDLEEEGYLVIFDEVGQEVEEIKNIIISVKASGLMDRIGIDPARVAALLDALEGAGLDDEDMIGISQGWRLMGAMTLVERKLANGTLSHGGTELMSWCMSNAKVEPRANGYLLTKQASGTGKIDPLMATLNAVELMGQSPEPKTSISDSIAAWRFNEAI